MHEKRRKLLKQIGTAASIIGASTLLSKLTPPAFPQTTPVEIEPASFTKVADYIVMEHNGEYLAIDGKTGRVAFGPSDDAATVIQSALDATPKGPIVVNDDIILTKSVYLGDDITLIINGTITLRNAGIFNKDETNGNQRIRIFGRGAGWHLIGCEGEEPLWSIRLANCSYCVVEGLNIRNFKSGICIEGGQYNRVANNYLYTTVEPDGLYDAIRLICDYSEAVDNVIARGSFRGITVPNETFNYGSVISRNIVLGVSDYGIWANHIYGWIIGDNYVNGNYYGTQNSGGGIGLREAVHCRIIGNMCINNYYDGISLGTAHTQAGEVVNYNLVANNVCANNNQSGTDRAGIRVKVGDGDEARGNVIANNICIDTQATPTQKYGIVTADYPVELTIIGNFCKGNVDHGISSDSPGAKIINNVCINNGKSGIVVLNDYNEVRGNRCYYNGQHGLYIGGAKSVVAENYCLDNSQASAQSYDGIYIHGDTAHIVNNFSTGSSQRYGLYLRFLNYNVVMGNYLMGNGVGGIGGYDEILGGYDIIKDNYPPINQFLNQTTDANGQITLTFEIPSKNKPKLSIVSESAYSIYVKSWNTGADGEYTGCVLQLSDGNGTDLTISGEVFHIKVDCR